MSTKYFIDTSALLKLYHVEKGTDKLDEIVNDDSAVIVISALTRIELVSAFARRVRNNELTPAKYEALLQLFEADLPEFEVVPLLEDTFKSALTLIKTLGITPGLRTLDALQLSAAIHASDGEQMFFVVSDKKLSKAAREVDLPNFRIIPVAIEE